LPSTKKEDTLPRIAIPPIYQSSSGIGHVEPRALQVSAALKKAVDGISKAVETAIQDSANEEKKGQLIALKNGMGWEIKQIIAEAPMLVDKADAAGMERGIGQRIVAFFGKILSAIIRLFFGSSEENRANAESAGSLVAATISAAQEASQSLDGMDPLSRLESLVRNVFSDESLADAQRWQSSLVELNGLLVELDYPSIILFTAPNDMNKKLKKKMDKSTAESGKMPTNERLEECLARIDKYLTEDKNLSDLSDDELRNIFNDIPLGKDFLRREKATLTIGETVLDKSSYTTDEPGKAKFYKDACEAIQRKFSNPRDQKQALKNLCIGSLGQGGPNDLANLIYTGNPKIEMLKLDHSVHVQPILGADLSVREVSKSIPGEKHCPHANHIEFTITTELSNGESYPKVKLDETTIDAMIFSWERPAKSGTKEG
jgi:hypothetical protein